MASKSPINEAQELQKLVVGYAKQETLDPLKSLGRYLGLGVAGALLIFMGVSFGGIGVLRLMQTLDLFGSEAAATDAAEQSATWGTTIPYFAAILTLSLALILIYRGLVRAKESVKQ